MYRFSDLYRGRQRQDQQLRQLADIRDQEEGTFLWCRSWERLVEVHRKGSPGGRHINQLARFGTDLPVPESVIRSKRG